MKIVRCIVNLMLLISCLVVLTGCHHIPTPTPPVPPTSTPPKVALRSFHGRYVIALGESDGWLLRQIGVVGECGLFTLDYLPGNKVTLKTCNGRFVTAPRSGSTRADWQVWQDSAAGDCGQFILEPYEKGVALKTCAGKYLTAGDDSWAPPLQWSVVAETDKVDKWEVFTME
jgi:hypothetical protein